MKRVLTFVMILAIAWQAEAMAGSGEHPVIQQPPSAEFDTLKNLAGKWEGRYSEKGKEPLPAKAEYRLTSGGTALVEILSPGSEHEMYSLYFNQSGKLAMTHYCMLGNRPTLEMTSSSPSGILLDLNPASGIDVAREPHMHALRISFPEPGRMIQEWTYYEDGRAAGTTLFDLKRAG